MSLPGDVARAVTTAALLLGAILPLVADPDQRGQVESEAPALTISVDVVGLDPQETAHALSLVLAQGVRRANGTALPLAGPTQITVSGRPDAVATVTTRVGPSGPQGTTGALAPVAPATLRSRASSFGLVSAVLLGDVLALWAGKTPDQTLPTTQAPVLLFTLRAESLWPLLGQTTRILDAAWGEDGLTLATTRGPVALGPLFRITPQTARDVARQPEGGMPIQAIQVPRTGSRVWLLPDLKTVVLEDLRSGTTREAVAPGSGYGGLVAAPWGGLALWRTLAGQPVSDLLVGTSQADSLRMRSHKVAGAFVTAAACDADGNYWLFDAAQRRIRVLDRYGREVHAIRPVLEGALLTLPHALEVYGDGSFLLAGDSVIWKLGPMGIPVWRLDHLAPGRALPRSYLLDLHGATGLISLTDTETQEIHVFAEDPAFLSRTQAVLAGITRSAEQGPQPATWALDNDLLLIAGQLLGDGETGGHDAAVLRRRVDEALARELAVATASWAAHLEGGLDLVGAEEAYAAAIGRYRALRDAYPTQLEYGRTLEALQDKRLALRETLQGHLELEVTPGTTVLHAEYEPGERALELLVSNRGRGHEVEGLVVEVAAADVVRPTRVVVANLAADIKIRLPLTLQPDLALVDEDRTVQVGIRLSGTTDDQTASMTRTLSLSLLGRLHPPPGVPLVRHLAWLAGARDPAVTDVADQTLELVGAGQAVEPLPAAALVYSLLADTFTTEPFTPEAEVRLARQSLAARSGTWADALVLAGAVLEDYGICYIAVGDATYLGLDTRLGLDDVGEDVLAVLRRLALAAGSDTAIIPLAPQEDTADPLYTAASQALREMESAPEAPVSVAWVADGPPVRSPHLWSPLIPKADLAARAVLDAVRTLALVRG